MKINEKVKKCVTFLQCKMANGDYKYVGTGFFVFRDKFDNNYKYIVTAKHVINGVKNNGLEKIFIRLNDERSTIVQETSILNWIFHEDPSVDIAVCPFYFKDNIDHLYYPESSFLTEKIIKENEIDCGDEVFITGLFKHHSGKERNIPIVRIGNISMMPEEKIQTKEHLIEAYLIESRSISGLSGSPVFVNYGVIRRINGVVKHATGNHIHNLLGVIHGHFDLDSGNVDVMNENKENQKINVGVAIVTPISKLVEIFNSQKVIELERGIDKLFNVLKVEPNKNV